MARLRGGSAGSARSPAVVRNMRSRAQTSLVEDAKVPTSAMQKLVPADPVKEPLAEATPASEREKILGHSHSNDLPEPAAASSDVPTQNSIVVSCASSPDASNENTASADATLNPANLPVSDSEGPKPAAASGDVAEDSAALLSAGPSQTVDQNESQASAASMDGDTAVSANRDSHVTPPGSDVLTPDAAPSPYSAVIIIDDREDENPMIITRPNNPDSAIIILDDEDDAGEEIRYIRNEHVSQTLRALERLKSQVLRRAHNVEDGGEDTTGMRGGTKRSHKELFCSEFGAVGETMRLVDELNCEVRKHRKLLSSNRTRVR